MTRRVVVVGAGPGGLAAAMLLAQAGVQVTIVERHDRVGGRTAAIERAGFRFDVGPTFFLYPQVLAEIFAAAGFNLFDELELVRLDPQYRLVFGAGGELLATPDLQQLSRAVAQIAPRDAAQVSRFIHENRVKFERFRPILQSPFNSWRDVLSPDLLRLLPLVRPWRSLDRELGSYFSDSRIRLAFSFQSKYLGMSPFNCPSLFSILSYLEYDFGVFHPIGGCSRVTEVMAHLLQSMGVELRLGEPVEEVLFDRGRAVGVRTARERLDADAVVMNADFARAMERMVPNHQRRRWTDERLARKRYSCSTFMLYLGIDGRYDDVSHHTIYLSRDYLRNLRQIEHDHELSDDPSFYVQNASVTDPTLAPPGQSTLYVLVPVTHEHPNVDWSREAPRYRRLVLERLAQVGIHDVERRIRHEQMTTPADWATQHQVYRGATFNLAHTLRQMLHLRPHNRFEDCAGMYLVGGGTHPGSGLPVIFESARISARLLLDDLGVSSDNWHDWSQVRQPPAASPERGRRPLAAAGTLRGEQPVVLSVAETRTPLSVYM